MEYKQMPLPLQKPSLWKEIPSIWFDFSDIYDEAVATAPPHSALVEVGSFWGQSVVYLAEAAKLADKDLRVYCVDLFDMRPENNQALFDADFNKGLEPPVHAQYHNSQFETFAHFVDSTRLSPDPLRILRMGSLEAADALAYLEPIHFLFLDDDHQYEHVFKELVVWEPLVRRPGGIIAGHDWTAEFWGVQKACEEYFKKSEIEVKGKSWIVRL